MKHVFSFLLLFLFTTRSFTQTNAFTSTTSFSQLNTDQNKVLSFVNAIPRQGDLKYLNWNAQGLTDGSGKITITLPGENNGQPIAFEIIGADYETPTQYALFGRSPSGNVALYVTPQGTGGVIDLVTSVYSIFPLGGVKGTMIKLAASTGEDVKCGTEAQKAEEMISYCEEDCGEAVLDVLAMITPAANTWLANTFGIYAQWFLFVETHNINGAFINSAIPDKRVRVRTVNYTPNFALTTFFDDDLTNFKNDIAAQQLALQNGADIRILLTNQNYPGNNGPFGGIPNNQGGPASTNKVGIVEVPFIGPIRFTFAHEVAHHFGCWHSEPTIEGCPNGLNMANGRNTIMANSPNNTRIQHFSNPDILFGGVATGTAGTRNNAAQIRGAFCEVANKVQGQYSVLISKNSIGPLCKGETHTFGANVFPGVCLDPFTLIYSDCATGPYQYEWRGSNSPDFQSSQVISTAQTATWTITECTFYLRVTVTSANGLTTTTTRLLQCAPGVACERGNGDLSEGHLGVLCTPNPAYDHLNVSYSGMGVVQRIHLMDITGKIISITNLSSDQMEVKIDISNLQPGIWFLYVQGTEKKQVVKLSIIR